MNTARRGALFGFVLVLLACSSASERAAELGRSAPSSTPEPISRASASAHVDAAPHDDVPEGIIGLGTLRPATSLRCRTPRFGTERVDASLIDLVVLGTRSEELVRRILVRHLDRLARCFEPGDASEEAPEGDVAFTLRFAPVGQVTRAMVNRLSPALEPAKPCLRGLLARVILPAEDPRFGSARVRAGVRFRARAAGSDACGEP